MTSIQKQRRRHSKDIFGKREPWPRANEIWHVTAPAAELERQLDLKWGKGRLIGLVPEEMALKFGRAREAYDEAIANADLNTLPGRAENLRRGLMAMDDAATKAGHQPPAQETWQVEVRNQTITIVRDLAAYDWAVRTFPGTAVYSLDEIGNLLAVAFEEMTVDASEVKAIFPGATVTVNDAPQKSEWNGELDDEIPF